MRSAVLVGVLSVVVNGVLVGRSAQSFWSGFLETVVYGEIVQAVVVGGF